jgi:hypothetical protein
MSSKKRPASQLADDHQSQPSQKKGSAAPKATQETEGMGDFEDEWDDEVDADENAVVDESKSDDEDGASPLLSLISN